MLVPFQDTPVEVEQNTELPDYLPEDESPTKEQDKAVSRVGSHPEGGASWLSTAANFLSRSFYWWLQFGSKDCVHQQGASFPLWCELLSAICNKLSKGLRLHDCVCCILHFIGHFTPWQRLQVELLCFGFVFFCLIASLCKKCGSVVKPNIYMCSFTFYFTQSTWLGKLVFSSSLRTYLKRSCFFFSASCAWITEYFPLLLFMKGIWLWYSSVKVENISHHPPFVPFFLPTMFIERTLLMTLCELKYIHLNVAVP